MDFSGELSDIQRFYKNTTVLVTGATDLIGKLLLEKILRSLPIKHVYVTVEEKNDETPESRFEKIFTNPIFDPLKRINPDLRQKVSMIRGDCALPGLGLDEIDKEQIIREVEVIFHCAESAKFDEKLRVATLVNVRATRDLLDVAKQIKKLKTFVYLSTAYSNPFLTEVKEKVYEPYIQAEKLITLCEILDEETVEDMTKKLLGESSNTYLGTKQVAEDLVNREGKSMPICIVRPTIVISTAKEPLAAYMEGCKFSVTGLTVGNALGVTRIHYCRNTYLDVVPADFVVNECIAAGWNTGESYVKKTQRDEIAVYDVTNVENPIRTDDFFDIIDYESHIMPSLNIHMYPLNFKTSCYYNYLFCRFFLHTLLAYIVDFVLQFRGHKPSMLDFTKDLHKFQDDISFFMTTEVFFHNENTNKLLKKMTFKDRELFSFDLTSIDWNEYLISYAKGLRVYMLRDPLETITKGKKHLNKLKIWFLISVAALITFVYVSAKILLFKLLPMFLGFVPIFFCGLKQ